MVKGPTRAASVMTLLASCMDTFVPKSQSAKKIVSVETFAMLLETETIANSLNYAHAESWEDRDALGSCINAKIKALRDHAFYFCCRGEIEGPTLNSFQRQGRCFFPLRFDSIIIIIMIQDQLFFIMDSWNESAGKDFLPNKDISKSWILPYPNVN